MIITENGWSDYGQLKDYDRIEYLRKHMDQVLNVVLNDQCNVKHYTSKLKIWHGYFDVNKITII